MRTELSFGEVSDLMSCISDYLERGGYFTQMGGHQENEKLKEYWETKIVKRTKNTWLNDSEARYWKDVNVHMVTQTWGSTAGGWPGVGGASMTTYYTNIIENSWFGLAFIYFRNKLAYICEMDEKYQAFMSKGYRGLPDYINSGRKLTVIYKTPVRQID